MRNTLLKTTLATLLLCTTFSAVAWNHSVSIGGGGGVDLNHGNYNNYGGLLTAGILPLKKIENMSIMMDGSLGEWYSTYTSNKDLFTAAVTFDLRAYLGSTDMVHPYFAIGSGPAYLSSRQFGQNNQGANFAFQTSIGGGLEIGQARRLDMSLGIVHFSNAYLFHPNQGFNIICVGSLGYLF